MSPVSKIVSSHIIRCMCMRIRLCTDSIPVTVFCGDGEIRLVNDDDVRTDGRVEICISEVWGTVCSDGWDVLDSQVVCTQLGFSRFSE